MTQLSPTSSTQISNANKSSLIGNIEKKNNRFTGFWDMQKINPLASYNRKPSLTSDDKTIITKPSATQHIHLRHPTLRVLE